MRLVKEVRLEAGLLHSERRGGLHFHQEASKSTFGCRVLVPLGNVQNPNSAVKISLKSFYALMEEVLQTFQYRKEYRKSTIATLYKPQDSAHAVT